MANDVHPQRAFSPYLEAIGLWEEAWNFFLDASLPDWSSCPSIRLHIDEHSDEGRPLHGFIFCHALLASVREAGAASDVGRRWQQLFVNAVFSIFVDTGSIEIPEDKLGELKEALYETANVPMDEPELLTQEEAMRMYQQASWEGCRYNRINAFAIHT